VNSDLGFQELPWATKWLLKLLVPTTAVHAGQHVPPVVVQGSGRADAAACA